MKLIRAFLLLALLGGALSAHAASAATIPIFDPNWHIVPNPQELNASCLPDAPLSMGAVLQVIQNLMNTGVALTVVIGVVMITYAGLLFMTAAGSAENVSKAKGVLGTAVIGFLVVISAWLIVDFVMKALYVGEDGQRAGFLPWNRILTDGDACIRAQEGKSLFSDLDFTQVPGGGGSGGGTGGGQGGTGGVTFPPPSGRGACNASTLKQAGTQGGVTLSNSEANTFACLAQYESTCGTVLKNYNWNRGSSAAGAFQVLLDGNAACYENAACRQAAGVSGSLNCDAGFRNGNPIPGSPIAQRCVNAAANLSCSLAAAKCVKDKAGSYRPWLADRNKAGQQSCISRYAN